MSEAEKKKKIAATLFTTGSNALKTSNFDYAVDCFLKCTKLVPEFLLYRQALRGAEHKKYGKTGKGAAGAGLRSQGSKMALKVAKARKKWPEVIESAEDALVLNPWDVDALLEICNACKEIGEMDDVGLWVAQNAYEAAKERVDVLRTLGFFYEQRGMFNEAINIFEQARKLDPRDTEFAAKIRQLAASDTIGRGKYEEQESAGKEDGSDAPRQTASPLKAAGAIAQQDTPEAKARRELAEIETKLAADPNNQGLHLQRGDGYRRLGDYDAAVQAYDKGHKATGDLDLRIRFLDMRIEQFKNKQQEAGVFIDKLNKSAPDYRERLAKAQKQIEQMKNAMLKAEMELFRARGEQNPDDHTAFFELGVRLLQAGDVDAAISALQHGRNDRQNKWKASFQLGLAFSAKRNFALAEKNLKDAMAAIPPLDEVGRKEIFYNLGRVAEDRGEKEAAIEHYNEVAAIDYAYRDVSKRLDALTSDDDRSSSGPGAAAVEDYDD